jgi:hypothetical protein
MKIGAFFDGPHAKLFYLRLARENFNPLEKSAFFLFIDSGFQVRGSDIY